MIEREKMKGKIISNKDAVSTTVSTVLIVAVVISSVSIVLGWGLPYIEEQRIKSQKQTAENGLLSLSDSINDLIFQETQTSGVSDISNENDKGSISLEPKSDRFVLWYSFNEDYNFSVSGLEDEDAYFNITQIDKPESDYDIDSIDIYKIDAENGLSSDNSDDSSSSDGIWYKPIYDNTTDGKSYCSQIFVCPGDWEIEGIRVFVARFGKIDTNLRVGIYGDDGDGRPDLGLHKATGQIDSINISYTLGWATCNFDTPAELEEDSKYHILLSTSGGNTLNYYYWYLLDNVYGDKSGENENSTDEYASYGYPLTPSNWNNLKGKDFARRVIYVDNKAPGKQNITIFGGFPSEKQLFSGIEYNFTLYSKDSDDDLVSYYVNWGDGNDTDWLPLTQDETPYYLNHKWKQAGTYTIILQVKDQHDNIGLSTSYYTIEVKPFETIPEDSYETFLNLTETNGFSKLGNTIGVDVSDKYPDGVLDGDLFINLIDRENVIYPNESDPNVEAHNGTYGKIPFGRIWVFDMGALTVEALYESGTIKTIYQNGAIISVSPDQTEFIKHPSIFEKNNANQTLDPTDRNALSMRFVQINGSLSAGGYSLTSTIDYKIINSISREPYVADNFSNLKMQIFGENADLWYDYLNETTNFVLSTDAFGNKILRYNREVDSYHEGKEEFSFIFDNSFIDFGLVRVR